MVEYKQGVSSFTGDYFQEAQQQYRATGLELKQMQDQFMTLDETGLGQARAEDKAQRQNLIQQLFDSSPARQKLQNQPPKAVRFQMNARSPQVPAKSKSPSPSPEMTDIQRLQAQTELLIKQQLTGKSSPRSKKIKLPKASPSISVQAISVPAASSNERSSSESEKAELPPDFNPNTYIMKEVEPKHEIFKDQFSTHVKANKKQINKKLVELVHLQVEEAIQEKYDMGIPEIFKGNIYHWSNLLVQSKRLQGIFADFNDQIAEVLDYEISHQKSFVKEYLMQPRLPGDKGFDTSMFIPREPSTKQQLSFFKKAKAQIRDLSLAVKKTEHKRRLTIQEVQREEERIRQALQKHFKQQIKEENKQLLLPVQEMLLEKISSLANHAALIDENNMELNEEVTKAERDLNETKIAKQGRNPGADIQKMLYRWEDDGSWFNHADLKFYANELWVSKERFEQELKEQQTAMSIELRERKSAYIARVDSIRSNASFQVQALESALIETKMKAARDVERAQMQLAEMESYYLNTQQEKKFVENALKEAESLIQPSQPGKPKLSLEEENRVLKTNLRHLLQTVESLNGEQKTMKQEMTELKGVIERDKAFNAKAQADFQKTKEMTIFYQMLIHDLFKRTKIFETKYATKQEKVLFKEIFDLNEQRAKQDQSDIDRKIEDPKRFLQRLGTYCDDLHKIFVQLDFKRLFDHFSQVNEEKSKMVQALALELGDIGIISSKHVDSTAEAINIQDLVKESDLQVIDKKTMDPSWNRHAPKRKQNVVFYEDLRNYQPIGIVRPERKQAIHTYVEQLLVPPQERLHFIIEQEQNEKLEREKTLAKEELEKIKKEKEAARKQKLKEEGGMMESQHSEIMKKFEGEANPRDLKKMADQFTKNQNQRAFELEKIEKAKAKELEDKITAEKEEVKRQAAMKAAQEAAEAKAAAKLKKKEEEAKQAAEAAAKTGKKRKDAKTAKGMKEKGKIIVKVDEEPATRNITTVLGDIPGDLDAKSYGGMNPIEDALNIVEDKINSKYETILKKLEGAEQQDLELGNKDFQMLYNTFTQSLGQDISSKDYNQMFSATNLDAFIDNANAIQSRYLRKEAPEKGSKGKLDVQVLDLLMPEIESNGEFKGFKIRNNLAKAWFMQNKDVSKLVNVLKTSTMLNRMLNNDISMATKPDKVGNRKNAQVQCDLLKEIVKIVEKEVYIEVPVEKEPSKAKVQTVGYSAPSSDQVSKFFEMVRNHCITVLVRENPDRVGYYKLVWKNQTPEELLAYKLENVFEEVPEEGLDGEDREVKMTVMEYFDVLFKQLAQKLLMNVVRDEKVDLDVKKWIWKGDIYEEPKIVEKEKTPVESQAVQTPAEWFGKLDKDKHEQDKFLGFKDKRSSFSRSNSKGLLASAQKPIQQLSPKLVTKTTGIQTGEELLKAYTLRKEESEGATSRLQEQIDQLMSQEIVKTIESMQMFMDQIKILPKPSNNEVREETPPKETLKRRLHALRVDLNEGVSHVKSDCEKVIEAKKIKKMSEMYARNTPTGIVDFGVSESKLSARKEKLPHITFPDFLEDSQMKRPSRFDTKKSPRLLIRVNSPKNLTQFGKPFRQINAQSGSSHFDPERTSRPSLLGRTTSDSVPPHVIRVRMEISSPTMAATDSTNQETIQQLPTFEKRPKRGSFFTGINSELHHGLVRGEILQNATATTFLSPSHTKLGFLSVRNQENLSQHIPRPTLYLNDNMSLTQTTGFAPQKIGANKDLISGGYNLLADPILTSRNVRNFTPNKLNTNSMENSEK